MMRLLENIKGFLLTLAVIGLTSAYSTAQTEIAKWQDGKTAAVSLTYDDGTINQFKVALPLMNQYKIPATFFIITGQIPGSQYQGKFIGRPVKTIIEETAVTPTNKSNFFERASAAAFLGYRGTLDYHTQAGSLYDSGRIPRAYALIDSLYRKVRNGDFPPADARPGTGRAERLTWDSVRSYMAQGHEFGSHTVTHPMTPVLDEVNLLYELEKSKEDLLAQLGPKATFSGEIAYGIEDERVMEYALKIYPALRNRMPEPWLEEINRANKKLPGNSEKEYVQWQRGATTKTPLPMMKAWVDTALSHKNNWLVLVIHGVDGIGFEALKHEDLDEYFKYIKSADEKLWVATFGDVTKYMRERMNSTVKAVPGNRKIAVKLTHSLDKTLYDLPLTLKTYIPSGWKQVQVKQGNNNKRLAPQQDAKGAYVLYQVQPNAADIELSGV